MQYVSVPKLEDEQNEDLEQYFALNQLVPQKYIGYNGEEASRNLIWNEKEGWTVFTTKNNLIFELIKEKQQSIIYTGKTPISTLAISDDMTHLAVAHGSPDNQQRSNIILFRIENNEFRLTHTLSFHDRGVSRIEFSKTGEHLVSVGTHEDKIIAVWNTAEGSVVC